ncbi:hypothetical protein ACFY5F_45735 [Streptomyces sp. NPDC013161]|uniref:hypothetical protein n=1 Tax=Streptomyces sp. NPDC013161 TaxID=3364862 RepID=UPI0036C266DF
MLRRKDQDGFAVLAKRRHVERAISWIIGAWRDVRDYERLMSHSEAPSRGPSSPLWSAGSPGLPTHPVRHRTLSSL